MLSGGVISRLVERAVGVNLCRVVEGEVGGRLDPRLVFGDRGRRNAANFAVLGWKTVGVAG